MNYNSLMNKPTINYRELIGDNTVTEVGGITEEQFNTLLNTDLSSYYTKTQIDDLFSRSYVYREKSGSIVTFDCPTSINGIDKVVSEIVAVQSGTGDPSPTNIRPISGWSAVDVYDTDINAISVLDDWLTSINVGHSIISKDTITIDYLTLTPYNNPCTLFDTDRAVTISVDEITGQATGVKIQLLDVNNTFVGQVTNLSKTFTGVGSKIRIDYGGGGQATFKGLKIYTQGATYTTQLKDGQGNPLTCYGGELSNVNGVQTLTVTHGYIASYNGETLPSTWISDRDVYAEGTTPTTGAEIVYELATPQTIPQDNLAIATQDGTNNIWADSGDITVKALDRIIQG